MTYQSLNPATGKLLKKFVELTDKGLETKIATAAKCFETWKHKSYAERAAVVANAAALLHKKTDEFAHIMTLEMGKRISEARGEESRDARAERVGADEDSERLGTDPQPRHHQWPKRGKDHEVEDDDELHHGQQGHDEFLAAREGERGFHLTHDILLDGLLRSRAVIGVDEEYKKHPGTRWPRSAFDAVAEGGCGYLYSSTSTSWRVPSTVRATRRDLAISVEVEALGATDLTSGLAVPL